MIGAAADTLQENRIPVYFNVPSADTGHQAEDLGFEIDGEFLSTYSFENLAKKYFDIPSKRKFNEVTRYSKKELDSSLLKDVSSRYASNLSENIYWYTKERDERIDIDSYINNAQYMIEMALDYGIVDELFCQLMKHLNHNPSKGNRSRTWELICLSCGSVLPSKKLKKYVFAYLHSRLNEDKGHTEMIRMSIERLENNYTSPVRRRTIRPSMFELKHILTGGSVPLDIYLPNKECFTVHTLSHCSGEELIEQYFIETGIDHSHSACFALYEVFLNNEKIERSINNSENIMDILAKWEDFEKEENYEPNKSFKFVLKIKFYFGKELWSIDDPKILDVMAHQFMDLVTSGSWKANDKMAISIGSYALRFKQLKGDPSATDDVMIQYISPHNRSLFRAWEWPRVLYKNQEKENIINIEDLEEATRLLINEISKLNLFGSSIFEVEHSSGIGIDLAIGPTFIKFIQPIDSVVIKQYRYHNLKHWEFTRDSFFFTFEEDEIGLNTIKGTEIASILNGYYQMYENAREPKNAKVKKTYIPNESERKSTRYKFPFYGLDKGEIICLLSGNEILNYPCKSEYILGVNCYNIPPKEINSISCDLFRFVVGSLPSGRIVSIPKSHLKNSKIGAELNEAHLFENFLSKHRKQKDSIDTASDDSSGEYENMDRSVLKSFPKLRTAYMPQYDGRWKVFDIDDRVSYQKVPIEESMILHDVDNIQYKVNSVSCFCDIMKFMGDLKINSGKRKYFYLQRALIRGIEVESLQTEILFQICKQINFHPDPEHEIAGWNALCITLSTFLPSKGVIGYITGFLHDKIEDADEDVSERIIKAKKIIQKYGKLSNRRKYYPSSHEMESIEKNTKMKVHVKLGGTRGDDFIVKVSSFTTVEKVLNVLKQMLVDNNVPAPSYYCLVERVEDTERELLPTEYISDLITIHVKRNKKEVDTFFVLKRVINVTVHESNPLEATLMFYSGLDSYLASFLEVENDENYINIAATVLHIEGGDISKYALNKDNLDMYVPSNWCESKNKKEIVSQIKKRYRIIPEAPKLVHIENILEVWQKWHLCV
eukprot:TRINITY_DN7496_c0_g1_i3.p1 TRINITY_DN7496_c0_g1~~TRINITY_DN7496_c0_g1_i3.p1  ORF type:complete len:1057 (-),score=222.70 TRINITY_DN7496_c0_g1_i3:3359-6529(-)